MSHDNAHARYSHWDSAYVLGALSPAEREEYEKHLEQCELCRAAIAELTPMPGLLARLSAERAEGILDDLPGSLLEGTMRSGPSPQLVDLVRLEDRRRTRRRIRIWALSAAAAVIVAAAIVVPLLFARRALPAPQTLALEAIADVPLTASVTLTPADWGTRLDLDCRYAKSVDGGTGTAWSYGLYVTGDDGTTSELSTWRIAPGSIARISAASALTVAEIQSIEIRPIDNDQSAAADDGRRLSEPFRSASRVPTMKKLNVSIAVVALTFLSLTGCTPSGTGTTSTPSDSGSSPSESSSAEATTGITSLMTADTDLGTIVVDDKGLTVYQFDSDTQNSGVSTCTGACLATWPPVNADTAPSLDGVTGEVGTITGTDGSTQVTLNGWPLYYFSGDAAAGDTNGQGVQGIWWVLAPDGTKITS